MWVSNRFNEVSQ